ncbi:MAG: hypothetical protein GVY33_09515 [Alphaproteobacteria bacterium]|nr:hypothetical protein [Alphaproteobacteria bacterium]
MLTNVTHAGGVENADEILFTTPFGYLFLEAAHTPDCLLAVSERTEDALTALGNAIGDASTPPDPALDSDIPAAFTYLGQFIDHDLTARTDREIGLSRIAQPDGRGRPITPVAPDTVVGTLRNGRRPELDLDSVYGDGPGLLQGAATEASALYEAETNALKLQEFAGGFIDVPRVGRKALIADGRNDENVNISQLHAAFIAFHNAVAARLPGDPSPQRRYAKARQIVRWAYQYVVVHDYLMRVCDPAVVQDLLYNGPRFYRPGGEGLVMPLEFSVAAFRFGHSMIRPSYRLQDGAPLKTITELLGVTLERDGAGDLLEEADGRYCLKSENRVAWAQLVEIPGQPAPQMARAIDPVLSRGLFDLVFEEEAAPDALIRHLARRNLARGYLLSIPTGQAVAAAMGVEPLIEAQLFDGESEAVREAIEFGRFQRRTPLWYYVLREAKVQAQGCSLGEVGSRLVAETIVGALAYDPVSYLNNRAHGRVRANGIKVPKRTKPVATLADIVDYAGIAV